MNRTFYALLLAPVLASAACAVGEEGTQPTSEVGTAESAAIVDNPLIGTYAAKGLGAGKLALLVLKTDGTYHSAQVVYCVIGPCPPVAVDGRYRQELRADASFLTLMTDKYEIVAKYQYVLAGETLVPELMQHAATPEAIADAVAIALDPATEARLVPRFRAIHEALRRDADRSAADAIAGLVESSR